MDDQPRDPHCPALNLGHRARSVEFRSNDRANLQVIPRIPQRSRATIVSMKLALDYELVGCANNSQVVLTGSGSADPGSGRVTLAAGADRIPLGWDPALVLLGGMDILLLVSATRGSGFPIFDLPHDGLPVLGRTHAEILDDQGREAGITTMAWYAHQLGDVLSWRGQLLKAQVGFEVLERITTVPPFHGVVISTERQETILTSTLSFETNRGSSYRCVVTTRADLILTDPTQATPQFHLLTVEPIRPGSRQEELQVEFDLIARVDALSPAAC